MQMTIINQVFVCSGSQWCFVEQILTGILTEIINYYCSGNEVLKCFAVFDQLTIGD